MYYPPFRGRQHTIYDISYPFITITFLALVNINNDASSFIRHLKIQFWKLTMTPGWWGLRYGSSGNNWLNSNALQNQECYDNKWNCFLMDFTCIDSEYWLVRCRMRTSSSEQRKLENWIIYVCLLESAMHVSKFNICNM